MLLSRFMIDVGVVTLHYAINQLSATTHIQLYFGSQITCATKVER